MVLVPWNTRRWQCRAPSLKGAHLLRLVRRIRKRREGNKQNACLVIRKLQLFRLSSHSGMLRDFERRKPSYRSSWKGREWTSSAFRKPTWQMFIASPLEDTNSSDMTSKTWPTCCAENLTPTTARTSTCWLTAYFRQQSRPSPEAEERTTSLTGVTTYSASMTKPQKPENDLSWPLRRSTLSSTTRQGLLLTKKRSRKPASHGKKRLAHSPWRKTHGSSGIGQRPWMTISSMPQEQSFWKKVPRSSRAAYLLVEDSLLDISRKKQADKGMKTTEQLQKQSPTPSMTSEFSIHELNCAIRQLKKQNKTRKPRGRMAFSNEMIRHLESVAKQKQKLPPKQTQET